MSKKRNNTVNNNSYPSWFYTGLLSQTIYDTNDNEDLVRRISSEEKDGHLYFPKSTKLSMTDGGLVTPTRDIPILHLGFKKGGTIHIKKENRGKFTDYCGGKVTDECIQRGKHSSNPAVRKRATFAANARKWKHFKGGAFKEGVNVLDSNPSLYKTIKKKIKMHQAGAKFDWNGLANVGVNALSDILKSNLQNKILTQQIKLNEALAKKLLNLARVQALGWAKQMMLMYKQYLDQAFLSGNSFEQNSDIVNSYLQNKLANSLVSDSNELLKLLNEELMLLKRNNLSTAISNSMGRLINFGLDYLSNANNNTSNFEFAPTAKETWDMYKNPNSLSFDINLIGTNLLNK